MENVEVRQRVIPEGDKLVDDVVNFPRPKLLRHVTYA